MTARLWRYELYKALFTYKCIWMILAFILLKAGLLCILPEQTDVRLRMSRTPYEEALYTDVFGQGIVIYGEATQEKNQYIADTCAYFQQVRRDDAIMSEQMRKGEISSDEYWAYHGEIEKTLSLANRYGTAFEILNEKRLQFEAQRRDDIPPSVYFDEYDWASVLTYIGWLDPLVLLIAMILAIQMICPDIISGAFGVNRATMHGRTSLFFAKLAALATIICIVAALNAALESVIFSLRFDLREGNWPIYSITPFQDARISLTLSDAFKSLSIIRATGIVLTGLLAFALTCFFQGAAQSAFAILVLVVLPWLALPELTVTPGAWLAGKSVLLTEHRLVSVFVFLVIVVDTLAIAYWLRFWKSEKKSVHQAGGNP